MISRVENLLGGSSLLGNSINTEMDLYRLSSIGIPKKSLVKLVENINTTMRSMAKILHVTERTLQRKKDLDLLSEDISEHVIQIAEVYTRGIDIFESAENFSIWMDSSSIALDNKKPNKLLSSRYGIQLILNELGRIEHGVFS